VIAVTFQHAAGPSAAWMVTGSPELPVLRLRATPGAAASPDLDDTEQDASVSGPPAASDGEAMWHPVSWLVNGREPAPRLHSIQRDRLSTALRKGARQTALSLRAWLTDRRAAAEAVGPS